MSITINGATNTLTAASGLTIAGNTAVTGELSATGTLRFGEGGSGGFLGIPIDAGYMRIHGSNAINQGAGIILFGTGSPAPDKGRLLAAASTVAEWSSTGLAVTGGLSATQTFRTTGYSSPASGAGVEVDYGAAAAETGRVLCYDRTVATAKALQIAGLTVAIKTGAGIASAFTFDSTSLTAGADNTYNLGSAALGWKELFCDNGTINTSDARRKTDVSALSTAEVNAAKQLAKEIGSFKFLAAVAEKGDAARLHIGMTVQRAIEIMEANGLNPFAYSFICYDSWQDVFVEHPAVEAVAAQDAVLNEDGNVVTPAVVAVEGQEAWTEQTQVAGDKYSFRVHELLLFMTAGFEARLSALEAA